MGRTAVPVASQLVQSSLLVKSSCEFKAIHLKHHRRQGLWRRQSTSATRQVVSSYIKFLMYTFFACQEIEPSARRVLRAPPRFFWPRTHIFPKSSARRPSQASTFKDPREAFGVLAQRSGSCTLLSFQMRVAQHT